MAVELATAYISLLPSTSKLSPGIRGSLDKTMPVEGKRAGGRFSSAMGSAIRTGGKTVLLAAGITAGAALMSGFKAAVSQQNAQKTLAGLYGSTGQARKALAGLNKVASKSPLGHDAFRKGAESLAYAGVKGKDATQVLKNVGLAIVSIGGTSENMDRATDAVLKMVNAGKVTLDSLQQLSDTGVPIIAGLAAKFHVSNDEINKMASNGKVKLQDVISVMKNATGKNFKQAIDGGSNAIESFGNQWKIAKDNVSQALGKAILPLLEKLTPVLAKAGEGAAKFFPRMINGAKGLYDLLVKGDFTASFGRAFGLMEDSGIVAFLFDVRDAGKAAFGYLKDRILPVVIKGFGNLWDAVKPIIPAVKNLAGALLSSFGSEASAGPGLLATAFGILGVAVKIAAAVLTAVINFVADHIAIFKAMAVGVLAVVAAMKAWTLATKIAQAASKAFAVVQAIVNAVLSANPIAIIILALIGLAAALVYAYKHSETFRKIVQAAWHGIQVAASFAWNKIIKPVFQAFVSHIKGTWQDFQSFGRAVGRIWSGLTSAISGAWKHGIRPVFRALADFITKTVPHAFRDGVQAITHLWDKIKSAAKKPVNFIINTVYMHGIRALWNKVSGAVGLSLKLPAVSPLAEGGAVPASKAGWRNRPTAIVGEGSSAYPEVVIPTDPKHRTRALNLWSQAGGRLMDSGGWLDAIKVGLGLGARNATKRQFGADPVELITKGFDKIRDKLSGIGGGSFGTMMAQLPKKLMTGLLDKLKGSLFSAGDIGGSGVQRWAPLVRRALSLMGLPVTDYLVGITLRRMNQESGGNPNVTNNWDINAQRGDPSRGLMQTIGSTFRAYHFPGTSWNIFDPLANILASMRYALARYGSLGAAYNRAGGYANGGDFRAGELMKVGERGTELVQFGTAGHVYPHRESAGMAGQPIVLEVRPSSGSSGLDRLFLSWFQGALRENPGVKLKVAS